MTTSDLIDLVNAMVLLSLLSGLIGAILWNFIAALFEGLGERLARQEKMTSSKLTAIAKGLRLRAADLEIQSEKLKGGV